MYIYVCIYMYTCIKIYLSTYFTEPEELCISVLHLNICEKQSHTWEGYKYNNLILLLFGFCVCGGGGSLR